MLTAEDLEAFGFQEEIEKQCPHGNHDDLFVIVRELTSPPPEGGGFLLPQGGERAERPIIRQVLTEDCYKG